MSDEVRLTPKGRATRQRIIEAAADLIFERGVARTSIEDVRKAAGVSGSQMTHYFTDKRSLIRAVIAWQADTVVELHRQPALDELATFDALYLWAEINVQRQLEAHCAGGCRFGSLAGELAEHDGDTRTDLARGFERWEELFRHGLHTMRDRGDLRADADPDELALGLLTALQGGMLMTQTKRDVAPLVAVLNGMLAHVRSFATDEAIRTADTHITVASAPAA
ncbi:TetR/AcrR family transcriptional regulator [Actinoallomurus bryophytorum]|uniref:TetR family transcriptional regulator n=1 Tax=Actinoallomurus bryophytorum TaxID=1490222 RepID=A0A543CI79_9ACTN|nr:TetR/AcrR family transcriptional regulator [Actinoallomurus bryophytorum]TQL96730.1 TetR family transcriptional regulator [Actinoallomurus bryophytorum]